MTFMKARKIREMFKEKKQEKYINLYMSYIAVE